MSTRRSNRAQGVIRAPATPRSRRRGPYREPPTADLPGLNSVHDGSYGTNTLQNLDSGKRKGNQSQINREEDEDSRFRNQSRNIHFGMERDLNKMIVENKKDAQQAPGTSGDRETSRDEATKKTGQDEDIDDSRDEISTDGSSPRDSNPEKDTSMEPSSPRRSPRRSLRNAKATDAGVKKSGQSQKTRRSQRSALSEAFQRTENASSKPSDRAVGLLQRSGSDSPFQRSFNQESVLFSDATFATLPSDSGVPSSAVKPTSRPVNPMPPVPEAQTVQPKSARDINDNQQDSEITQSASHSARASGQIAEGQRFTQNQNRDELTDEEFELVCKFMQEIRQSESRGIPQDSLQITFGDLSTLEKRKVRGYISNMGRDTDTSRRIVDNLSHTSIPRRGVGNSEDRVEPEIVVVDPDQIQHKPDMPRVLPLAPPPRPPPPRHVPQMPPPRPSVSRPENPWPDKYEEQNDASDESEESEGEREVIQVRRSALARTNGSQSEVTKAPLLAKPGLEESGQRPKRNSSEGRDGKSGAGRPQAAASGKPAQSVLTTYLSRVLQFLFYSACLGVVFLSFLALLAAFETRNVDNGLDSSTSWWDDLVEARYERIIPTRLRIMLSSDDAQKIWNRIDKQDVAIRDLQRNSADTKQLINRLQSRLPNEIHVDKDEKGKMRISQEFWQALRDMIKADDIIITLENAKSKGPGISDDLWLAIESRLNNGNWLSPRQSESPSSPASTHDIELVVDNKLKRSWDDWIERNEELLKGQVTGTVVTKNEFVGLFQREMDQSEVRRQMTAMNPAIKTLEKDLSRLRGELDMKQDQAYVDREIEEAVRRAMSNFSGKEQWQDDTSSKLFHGINFFSPGEGALIDPTWTSPAWKMPTHPFKNNEWFRSSGLRVQSAQAAISPGMEPGECFCAGPDLRGHGAGTNNVSVLMSRDVIPRNLVVDHVLPSATLDDGATPRLIEVWAYFEEVSLRKEVETFMASQWPDTKLEDEHRHGLVEGFVKIGQFLYRYDGAVTQVFNLHHELQRMRAYTFHVVVRAVNNYGADHTCFYRLRLYGDLAEDGTSDNKMNNRHVRSSGADNAGSSETVEGTWRWFMSG